MMIKLNGCTVDSQYNEPRREMKYSSLYWEFVKSKIEKIGSICSNIKSCIRVVHLHIFFQLVIPKKIKDVFFLIF